jgi:hypothetical protein
VDGWEGGLKLGCRDTISTVTAGPLGCVAPNENSVGMLYVCAHRRFSQPDGGHGGCCKWAQPLLLLLLLPPHFCCYCCRYGYTLAAGAVGRGRGSRALLRQALMLPTTRYRKSRFFRHSAHTISAGAGAAAAAGVRQGVRAVVHDASYWSCLQLSGQQQQLVQLLQQVRCVMKVVTGAPSHRAHWQKGCYKGHASNYVATDPSHGGTQPARKGAAARAHSQECVSAERVCRCVSTEGLHAYTCMLCVLGRGASRAPLQ